VDVCEGILKRGLVPALEYYMDETSRQRLQLMNMYNEQSFVQLDNVTWVLDWMEGPDRMKLEYLARGYLA